MEVKGDSKLATNFFMGEWFLADEVITELVSQIKRFRREEKMNIKFTWVSMDTKLQPIAENVGRLAWNRGANVIEWANSKTVANVHNVKLIEAYWVCRNLGMNEQKIC